MILWGITEHHPRPIHKKGIMEVTGLGGVGPLGINQEIGVRWIGGSGEAVGRGTEGDVER